MVVNNYKITPNEVLEITNILRALGLNTSYIGTKLINKAIQYIIMNDIEFVNLEDIYLYLHHKYGFNIHSIRNNIAYSLNNRAEKITVKNFEKIFGFEYDSYYFTNKNIIEEIARVVKYKRIYYK